MPVLLAALALGLAAPDLIHGERVVTADDYPSRMTQALQSAMVNMEVVVNPAGLTESCRMIGFVRGPGFAEKTPAALTCALIKRRARFEPARDADGQPVYGVYRTWISYTIDNLTNAKSPDQVDLDVYVAGLPAGIADRARVAVAQFVAADGTPGACVAAPRTQPLATEILSPPLARAACKTLAGSGKLAVVTNKVGVPVATTRRLVARFIVGQSPAPAKPATP